MWKCTKCGATGDLDSDHVIPWSKGGSSATADNVQPRCKNNQHDKIDKMVKAMQWIAEKTRSPLSSGLVLPAASPCLSPRLVHVPAGPSFIGRANQAIAS